MRKMRDYNTKDMGDNPEKTVLNWHDAHCHLFNVAEDYNLELMLSESRKKGISGWLSNALNKEEVHWHVQNSIPGMHFSAGIHPVYDAGTTLTLDELETLCKEQKIFAIGEIGLDKNNRNTAQQLTLLKDQLSLARAYDLPVVFHIIGHYDLFYKALSDLPVKGIWHGFYAPVEIVRQFSKFDMTFSLGSVLIHSLKHEIVNAVIKHGNYLVETDAPYNLSKQSIVNEPGQNPLIKLLVLNNMVSRMNGVKIESLNQDLLKNIRQYIK